MTIKSSTAVTIATSRALSSASQLSPDALAGLMARGIDPDTAMRYGVRMSTNSNAIEFPYVEDGQEVNVKHRVPANLSQERERMWQITGGEQTLWNADILSDPDLYDAENPTPLIITEGETDALSFIQAGFERVVSPPNGAPNSIQDGPIDDRDGDFQWCLRLWDALSKVRVFIIATDNDPAGQNLAQEILRRFKPSRCMFVTYPEGCKDANDVLRKHGEGGIKELLAGAQPYPTKGLYSLTELPKGATRNPVSTGWQGLDIGFRPYQGEFVVLTGIPGSGKSTFITALIANLNQKHGWKACIGALENEPQDFVHELRRYRLRKPPDQASREDQGIADKWIVENFWFAAQYVDEDEQEFCLADFLEVAKAAVIHHGVKVVLLDPFNQLESRRHRDQTETEWTAECIRKMMRFARLYRVCFICICHPAKDAKSKAANSLSLYDISGSAHWANKPPTGLVLWRDKNQYNKLHIRVAKQRFRDIGQQRHECALELNTATGHFAEPEYY